MVLEFYYDLRSQPCRAVYYLLKLANVDYEGHKVDLIKGEQLQPEFSKINPLHKVPVLKDGDFILTESVAILRYIATKYNVPEHWYPRQDVQKQARVDEFLNWHHLGLRKPLVDLLLTKMRMRRGLNVALTKLPYDEEKIKELQKGAVKALNDFGEHVLKGKTFIAGDAMSVADLTGFCEIMQLDGVESDDLYKSIENVNNWIQRVAAKVEVFKEASTGLESFKELLPKDDNQC